MSNVEKLARDLRGILSTVLFVATFALLIGIAEDFAGHVFGGDDTDSRTQRSRLTLRTDFGTGCQYLETFVGGITPRLGSDGRQICGAHR